MYGWLTIEDRALITFSFSGYYKSNYNAWDFFYFKGETLGLHGHNT